MAKIKMKAECTHRRDGAWVKPGEAYEVSTEAEAKQEEAFGRGKRVGSAKPAASDG